MNLTNYYWYFESALTPRFCDEVIAYANKKKEVMALTSGYENKKVKCEKNKIVIFDAIEKHKAKIQTDTDTRMVININYEYI